MRLLHLFLLTLIACVLAHRPRPRILKRTNPSYQPLSDNSLESLTTLNSLDAILDYNNPESQLAKLLIPRAAGTQNLTNLQSMITKQFTSLGWEVERDHFEAKTPYGIKQFTNLIFTHDPTATRRLVLSAHLDSKFFETFPENQFIGATDSAAPCAMLLDLAQSLTPWLNMRRTKVEAAGGEQGATGQGETLQIIFFDGEEAFKDWTATDSIYGAKHLVEMWSKPTLPPTATTPIPTTHLGRISHLILLDLIGAADPIIRSFHQTTGWLFDEFMHAEERLGLAGLLWSDLSGADWPAAKEGILSTHRTFFVNRRGANNYGINFGNGIEDDHIPFQEKGVPVVHLISVPFPDVWHTLGDDASALHLPTIKAWAMIIRLTVAEYLGLDPLPDIEDEDEERARRRRSAELAAKDGL